MANSNSTPEVCLDTIGDRLIHAMEVREVKVITLANTLHVMESTVTNWRRSLNIRHAYILPICNALHLSPVWFLSGDGEMNQQLVKSDLSPPQQRVVLALSSPGLRARTAMREVFYAMWEAAK